MKRGPICSIIPDYIGDHIASSDGDGQVRERAQKAKLIMASIRRNRDILRAFEPQEGEKRIIHDAQGKQTTTGPIVRVEDSPDGEDETANLAYDDLGRTFAYYWEVRQRKSIDGKGMALAGHVHYGDRWDNAAYDGQGNMLFGDGDIFGDFAKDLSVVGHELTHGVTQVDSGLVYSNQQGALNEHLSDVGGSLVLQYKLRQKAGEASWLIGEDICKGRIQGRALRDMLHPGTAYDDPRLGGKDPQPADMAHYIKTSSDNGGVHLNSGIPNRAFALCCTAIPDMFAWETFGPIWYAASRSISRTATFQDFANATAAQAKNQLWMPASAAQPRSVMMLSDIVAESWKAVGITVGAQPVPTPQPGGCPQIAALMMDEAFLALLDQMLALPSVQGALPAVFAGIRAARR